MNNTTARNFESGNNYKFGANPATVFTGEVFENKKAFWQKIDFMNAIVVFFIIFISFNIINSIIVELKLNRQTVLLQHEVNMVKAEQNELKSQIALYKSPEGIEKLARERLGYIKVNEIPVRYIEKK